ncbi:hypothetical protein CRV02_14410 [Arcobacter sp. CECT 8989]|nr:hypothetical protein CRV02_14410 [Arcobacter sp. CECT 8989]
MESANAASKLISDDKVTAIIGALTSTNTMAMTKIAEEAKVPVVAPVATNILVTKRKDYVSRVCFYDDFQGTVEANFAIKELKEKEEIGDFIKERLDRTIKVVNKKKKNKNKKK